MRPKQIAFITLALVFAFLTPYTLTAQNTEDLSLSEKNLANAVNATFRWAVQAVRPAVVHIRVLSESESGPIYSSQASGSGCIIDPRGYIITNNHVVEDADTIKVSLGDGRVFDVTETYTDPDTDLAVVKIDPGDEDIPFARFGDSNKTHVGDFVLAIGSPFNLNQTVTSGIISYKGRQTNILGQWGYEDFIQTDADINKGNSGGPLVNLYGEIVGINSNIFSPTGVSAGYGFAIPSNIAKFVADRLINQGQVKRGWLGIKMIGLDEIRKINPDEFSMVPNTELRRFLTANKDWYLSIPDDIDGVVTFDVIPGDPADQAGMQARDIILGVNDRDFDNAREFRTYIGTIPPGKPADFSIWRNGEKITLEVVLGDRSLAKQTQVTGTPPMGRPETAPQPQIPFPFDRPDDEKPKLGVLVDILTPDTAEALGYPAREKGVIVRRVYEDSLAEKSGIQKNDIIVSADGRNINTIDDLKEILNQTDFSRETINLTLKNREGTRTISVGNQE